MREIIESTAEKIQPLLQQEANDVAEEKLEKFHQESPYRYAVAEAVYKGLRRRHKQGSKACTHVKSLEHPLLDALGIGPIPGPTKEDYNLGWHVFPDGTEKIWCLICKQPFTRKEAAKMWTTNIRSSSERILPAPIEDEIPKVQVVFHDPLFAQGLKSDADQLVEEIKGKIHTEKLQYIDSVPGIS